MGYLNACTFNYDNISSDLYDLAIGWTDSEDELDSGLDREIVKGDVNMIRHRANQYGTKYSSTIKLDFVVFHKDGTDFTKEESRSINRWLAPDTYKPLRFNDDDTDNEVYMAICVSIRDCVYNGFNAKHLSFECDSPFSYSPLQVTTFDASGGEDKTRTVYNLSDDGVYYPILEIVCADDYEDEITITNITDENKTMTFDFTNIENYDAGSKTLIVNTQNMCIIDGGGNFVPFYKLGWEMELNENEAVQSTDIYWFRLVAGANKITVSATCKMKMKCNYPRKAGVV